MADKVRQFVVARDVYIPNDYPAIGTVLSLVSETGYDNGSTRIILTDGRRNFLFFEGEVQEIAKVTEDGRIVPAAIEAEVSPGKVTVKADGKEALPVAIATALAILAAAGGGLALFLYQSGFRF